MILFVTSKPRLDTTILSSNPFSYHIWPPKWPQKESRLSGKTSSGKAVIYISHIPDIL